MPFLQLHMKINLANILSPHEMFLNLSRNFDILSSACFVNNYFSFVLFFQKLNKYNSQYERIISEAISCQNGCVCFFFRYFYLKFPWYFLMGQNFCYLLSRTWKFVVLERIIFRAQKVWISGYSQNLQLKFFYLKRCTFKTYKDKWIIW